MYCLKHLGIGCLVLLLTSCTSGLTGGSLTAVFQGISGAIVKSPTAVSLNWVTQSDCVNYQVFDLSSSSSSSIATASVPPVIISSPKVQPEHTYIFAVGCTDANGNLSGLGTSLSASTYAQFNDKITTSINTVGLNSQVELDWNYPNAAYFLVYAQQSVIPGDLTSQNNGSGWMLSEPNGIGTAYLANSISGNGLLICQTAGNSVTIGVGGTCNSTALQAGNTYNFKVIAVYQDNSYSVDLGGSGIANQIPSSFTPPNCVLTQNGIGPDNISANLQLRCEPTATVGSCSINNMNIQAFQSFNGSRTQVSPVQTGPGILNIAPHLNTPNDRLITGLEIEYDCTTTSPATKSIVRYDGTTTAYPQPYLKYQRADYEDAPPGSYSKSPSYLGTSFAIGDFDCDGKPDLAVGLPQLSLNQAPYNNANPSSGAVAIYYNYQTSLAAGTPPTYVSFRDLPQGSRFGYSLSAGNINKDVYTKTTTSGGDGNYYACDDLIVGAPGSNNINTVDLQGNVYTGQAFIFFGSPNGFSAPLDYLSITPNAPSCNGSTCFPARLQPEISKYFHVDPKQTNRNGFSPLFGGDLSQFGFSVAYIRDFNADGYGDIAIGDPYCSWDGAVSNFPTAYSQGHDILDVGCVYVFWGGPQGLNQNVSVGHSPDYNGSVGTNGPYAFTSPFVKVYPPFPQTGMHFGWSIAGGGDVDGRLPVPAQIQTGSGLQTILANGNDFVVGAPDFSYSASATTTANNAQTTGEEGQVESGVQTWKVDEANYYQRGCQNGTGSNSGFCPVDPIILQGSSSFSAFDNNGAGTTQLAGNKITPPWNGGWAGKFSNWLFAVPGLPATSNTALSQSTGIAFVYLGRSAYKPYSFPNSGNFYQLPLNYSTSQSRNISKTDLVPTWAQSLADRQNGSQVFGSIDTTTGTNWQFAPVDSFYNCGPRGGNLLASTSGEVPTYASVVGAYKHMSCLAGRNNFSVIYPVLNSSDSAVQQFGKNVAIAGAAEQNAVALLQTSFSIPPIPYTVNSAGTFNEFTQYPGSAGGGILANITGSSTWEIGIPNLTAPNTSATSCAWTTSTALNSSATMTCKNGTPILSRSIIDESYNTTSFLGSTTGDTNNITAIASAYTPIADINKDGYADVLVTASQGVSPAPISAKIYTYFGNYAADFSYQNDQHGAAGQCIVNRYAAPAATSTVDAQSILTGVNTDPTPQPYSTYYARYALESCAGGASSTCGGTNSGFFYELTGQYPESYWLHDSEWVRNSFLDDQTVTTGTIDFTYQTVTRSTNSTSAATNCKPQVQTMSYNAPPTSLNVADLNGDGIMDVITGISGAGNSNGTSVIYNGSTQGMLSSSTIGVTSTSANFGSAITATNWTSITGTQERDLFVGASGYNYGAGAGYYFSATARNGIANALASPIVNNNNFPNYLRMEESKIVGDINGDGIDDIWVPVKQFDTSGNTYFDAVIYYGSTLGPITYKVCNENWANFLPALASNADCLGTASPQTVTWNGVPILLPQYIARPTSVSANWALKPIAAGDVNRDGFKDIVFMETLSNGTIGTNNVNSNMYLFFGSSTGLIVRQPALGSSSTRSPQKVTSQPDLVGGNVGGTFYATAFNPYWNFAFNNAYTPAAQFAIVHGDFNGDGYEDIAFSQVYGRSPTNTWNCTANLTVYLQSYVSTDSGADPCETSIRPATDPYTETAALTSGYVIVLYGSAGGYQTPTTSQGIATDFHSVAETCAAGGILTGCTFTDPVTATQVQEVYGSLNYVPAHGYELDLTHAACQPPPTGSANPPTCMASLIRNPLFYQGLKFEAAYIETGFGNVLTVADVNGDGIDDLVVGAPEDFHPDWGDDTFGQGANTTIYGVAGGSIQTTFTANGASATVSSDAPQKGLVFVYYGAKGVGVVAPVANLMLADAGMGLSGTGANPGPSPIFQIYPQYPTANIPPLETSEYNRNFGANMTTGDFNGDGYDDIAITSGKGQVYVYYGPICQLDNSSFAMAKMYANPGRTCYTSIPGSDTDDCGDGTFQGGASACTLLNLNNDFSATNLVGSTNVNDTTSIKKLYYPQTFAVQNTTAANFMGTTLLSRRPTRSPASTTVTSNPGNMNGDLGKASDLIIASNRIQDPNISNSGTSNTTGMGFIFFGHAATSAQGTSMTTLPGLYTAGTANYAASLISTTFNSAKKYYFYSPVTLKPYSSDGAYSNFFVWETSMGDINGDGTVDLMFPTQTINRGGDNTNSAVIYGGGFKLLY